MSKCETVYPDQESLSIGHKISFVMANTTVGIFNILANMFLIYALSKLRQLSKVSYKLILCLSMSDFCVGLILQPLVTAVMFVDSKELSCHCKLAAQSFSFMFCQFSGVMIMIITLDRYLHMKYLNKYSLHMTHRVAYLLIAGNVLSSICIMLSSIFASRYDRFFPFQSGLIVLDSIVILTIFILYTSTYVSVKNRVQDLQTLNINVNKCQTGKRRKMNTKGSHNLTLAKTMVFILISLVICYLPYFIVGVIRPYKKYIRGENPGEPIDVLLLWSYICVYMNSFLNVLVFVWGNKSLQTFMFTIVNKNMMENNNSTAIYSDAERNTITENVLDRSGVNVKGTT